MGPDIIGTHLKTGVKDSEPKVLTESEYLIIKEAHEACTIEDQIIDKIITETGKSTREVAKLLVMYSNELRKVNKDLLNDNKILQEKNIQLEESVQHFIHIIKNKNIESEEVNVLLEKIKKEDSPETKESLVDELEGTIVRFIRKRNMGKLVKLAKQFLKDFPEDEEWVSNNALEIEKNGGENYTYGVKKFFNELKIRRKEKEEYIKTKNGVIGSLKNFFN